MAFEICYNWQVQQSGVCHAAETILIDEATAHTYLPVLAVPLRAAGVAIRGDERARAVASNTKTHPDDFAAQFLDHVCATGGVTGMRAQELTTTRFVVIGEGPTRG